MIAINFDAVVGIGIRQRVIQPALKLTSRPVLIVSNHREVLATNWGEFDMLQHKMTLVEFERAASRFPPLPPDLLILMEEMHPHTWLRIDPLLQSIDNEIWTINRRLPNVVS